MYCRECLLLLLLSSVSAVGGFPAGRVAAAQDAVDDAADIRALERAAGGPVTVRRSAMTGTAAFVTTQQGRAIRLPTPGGATAGDRARAFVAVHGRIFGLRDVSEAEIVRVEGPDDVGMEHVRMQQRQDGVPVTGGEFFVHLRGSELVAASGKTLPPQNVNPVPSVAAAEVVERVRAALGDDLDLTGAAFSAPRLELFNRGLLEGRPSPTRLAWFVEATTPERREFVWIDAQHGDVLLHVNQMPAALGRHIFDAMNTPDLPETLARYEGTPPTGDAEVDNAYLYSGDAYNYFFTEHGRDSFDNAGGAMIATVRTCGGYWCFGSCPCDVAQWTGTQTRFGAGWVADDVVGHEWTHGVDQYSAGFIYMLQPGALDESYADIFGETIDLGNGSGNDAPEMRWLFGEDVPGFGIGAWQFLNMMDPPMFGHPGKLSDPQLVCSGSPYDFGDTHTNNGVPNHAYALMVDGGTYNGFTITGIGLTKAGKIEYRALTQYLGVFSNFQDNYDALRQACADLIGTAGITATDCDEAQKALDAVEMNDPWPCLDYCGNGIVWGGEQCDDGNNSNGDCCSWNCEFETPGSPCNDGLFCDGTDTCSDGRCEHGGDPCDPASEVCDEISDRCQALTPAPTVTRSNTPVPEDTETHTRTVTPTDTPTAIHTATPTATTTPTASVTSSASITATATPSPSATPTATGGPPCAGDCNNDDKVTINELILGVNIALGRQPLANCPEFDRNNQDGVEINELVAAVDNALNGCGG